VDIENGHAVFAATGIVRPAKRHNGFGGLAVVGRRINFELLDGRVDHFAEICGLGFRGIVGGGQAEH
jgi:hypothetical protein